MYRLYGAAVRLAWAAVLPYQAVIALLNGGRPPRLGERLGRPRGCLPGGLAVHAVSVGEVRLALPLIARLKERHPGLPVHLTTTTATGRALAESARDHGGPGTPESISEPPLDLPGPVARFLQRVAPRAIVIVETEIWPNFLRLCGRDGVPVILVNGRISPRAFPRYRAARRLFREALHAVRLFGMQSEEDALRIRLLGAPAERVRVTGNLKYDLPVPDLPGPQARASLGLGPGEPLFVAGSTAPGEEDAVLGAFEALRGVDASVRLALAPRHPESLPRAEAALRSAGLRVASYSRRAGSRPAADGRYDALLVDVVGVLPEIYAAADIVFVGGSLVPRGGQNILEPAALGKPVLFGPHMENFRSAAAALTEAGGGFVARDGRQLADLAVRLLTDRAGARVAGTMARRVVESNRGALEHSIRLIEEVLGPPARSPGLLASRP